MDRCFRCGADENQLVLYDGLYGFESVKTCERCAQIARITLIKIPTASQLKESEKPYGVRERLMRITGIQTKDKTKQAIDSVKKSEINSTQETIEKPKQENLVFRLIDNFHWTIQTTRRRKGITIKQMAENIKESQAALEMLEKGKLPGNSLDLIMKVEQFLGISLIKRNLTQEMLILNASDKTFLGEKQREEREGIIADKLREENIKRLAELAKQSEDKSIDFSRHSLRGITVSDLKKVNEQIEKDTTKKTALELGEEQFENFGKENMDNINRKLGLDEPKKDIRKKTPSIYDLMKQKEERDKKLVGRDIEIANTEVNKEPRRSNMGLIEGKKDTDFLEFE